MMDHTILQTGCVLPPSCTSGAWRKSPYSLKNAITRQNRDFPLAKLARYLRCAALVFLVDLNAVPAAFYHIETALRIDFDSDRPPEQLLNTGRLMTRGIRCWEFERRFKVSLLAF